MNQPIISTTNTAPDDWYLLDWFNSTMEHKYPSCSSLEEIKTFDTEMTKTLTYSWALMAAQTGCYAKCTVRHFDFISSIEEQVT